MAGSMSISGIVSGVDWDSMIDSIIEAAQKPAMVKVNKRTNLVNKKSLFEEMKVSMQSLQSSISPLKLPSTYKAKEIEIERLDRNGSSKGVLTATVNADAEVAVYDLKVEQLATAQTVRSNQITSSNLSGVSNMPTNSTLYITAAGQKVGINVSSSDSLQSLKSKINNKLKTLSTPIDVTASVVDNRLIIKSDNTGIGATNVTESFDYGLNDVNTLSNIYVEYPEDLTLKDSNGKTYTLNQDYQVVNGNEIRWITETVNSDAVKTGDSYSVSYVASGSDSFKSAAITRGSSTTDSYAKALNFSINEIKDQSRFYVTAANGEILTDNSVSSDNTVRIQYSSGNKRENGNYYLTLSNIKSQLGITSSMDDDEIAEIFNKAFILTDDDGNTYEYGTDFELVNDETTGWLKIDWITSEPSDKSELSLTYYTTSDYEEKTYYGGTDFNIDTENNNIVWVDSDNAPAKNNILYLNYFSGETLSSSTTQNQTILRLKDSDDNYLSLSDIKSQLGITSGMSDTVQNTIFNQSLTVRDGSNTYSYGTDYTLVDNGNGWAAIEWLDDGSSPSDISSLTITFTNQPSSIISTDNATAKNQNIIRLQFDSGENSYGSNKYLSYNQIMSYLKIDSSSSDSDIADNFNSYFTVSSTSDDTTKTYTYGTDFTVSKGDSGWAVLNWITDEIPDDVAISLNTPATTIVEGGTIGDSSQLYIMRIPYENGVATND